MAKVDDSLNKFPAFSEDWVDVLDWVWLIDFGQGNFAVAQQLTAATLSEQRNSSSLLAHGLVCHLQGEYNQALSLLEEAFTQESNFKKQIFIALVGYLTECKARGFIPNQVVRYSLLPLTIWQQRIELIKKKQLDNNEQLLVNFVYLIGAVFIDWHQELSWQISQHSKQQYLNLIQTKITEQLELYQNQQYYAIADYLYGYLGRILVLSGEFKAGWELLGNLASSYRSSLQYLESAWYLLSQGDLLVQTYRFTQSRFFNSSFLEIPVNLLKINPPDFAIAQQVYLKAKQYFVTASAPRGEAMIMMRLAYLNALAEQYNLAVFGYEEATKYFIATGDKINAITAEMGRIWSYLQYQKLQFEQQIVIEESMDWIFAQGSMSWGISWLLAFLDAGEETLLLKREIDVSLQLVMVAEIIANKAMKHTDLLMLNYNLQIWFNSLLKMETIYHELAVEFALQNDWQHAFTMGEKAHISSVLKFQTNLANHQEYLEIKLSNIQRLNQLIKYIPENTLLLTYLVTKNQLLAWAVSSQGLLGTKLATDLNGSFFSINALEQILNFWLKQLPESPADRESNDKLEKILLEPFANLIHRYQHLLIVPDPKLLGVSFSALQYRDFEKNSFSNKQGCLGINKTISYLLFSNQLLDIEPNSIASDENILDNPKTTKDEFLKTQSKATILSLNKALGTIISNLYQPSTESNIEIANQDVLINLKEHQLTHLFLAENTDVFSQLNQPKNLPKLLIINLPHSGSAEQEKQNLISLIQKVNYYKIKTVVIIFEQEDSLSTALLTLFFHQGLYSGLSVAQALQKAQKQLSLTTTQEVLNFCNEMQKSIPWNNDQDRALRSLITIYTGNILSLGGDYNRATEAYEVAIKILKSTGYTEQVNSFQGNYQMFKSLGEISTDFKGDRVIYDAPIYWSNAYIFGNWELSFKFF